jgi:hypothetical protein
MFVTVSQFHINLIFVGKVRSLPLECSPLQGYTFHLGRFQPCLNILDHAEETDSDKYSILLQWGINYSSRMFYKTGQWV